MFAVYRRFNLHTLHRTNALNYYNPVTNNNSNNNRTFHAVCIAFNSDEQLLVSYCVMRQYAFSLYCSEESVPKI